MAKELNLVAKGDACICRYVIVTLVCLFRSIIMYMIARNPQKEPRKLSIHYLIPQKNFSTVNAGQRPSRFK
jgi:hypothetical protein